MSGKGQKLSKEAEHKTIQPKNDNLNGKSHPMLGRKHTEESKKKMRIAALKNKKGKKNPFYGKKHTEETKQKIRNKLKGRKIAPEVVKRMSKTLKEKYKKVSHHQKGRKMTEETKIKIRISNLGKHDGLKNGMYGRKQSKETIEKRISKLKGSNNANWNPNRNEVARNARVRNVMIRYLKLPLNVNLDACIVIDGLGYTKEEYFTNIEKKFYADMEWLNHGINNGYWQIHHVIPIAWLAKQGIEDPRIINALENLRPLWFEDHMAAHRELKKFTTEQRKFWVELFAFHIDSKRHPLDLSILDNADNIIFTSDIQSSSVSIPFRRPDPPPMVQLQV